MEQHCAERSLMGNAKMMRFILLLLLCTTDVLNGKLTLLPSTLYVFVGQTARFNCSTDSLRAPADWRYRQYGSHKTNAIFESGFFKSSSMNRYEIDGRNDLVISNVRLDDAGTYICLDDAGKGERAQAELVIIETDPACSSNITSSIGVLAENSCHLDPDYIEYRCSVKYGGNAPPVLELEWLNQPTLEFINETGDILLENDNNRLLVINRFVAQGSKAINGSSAICRLKYVTSTQRNNITCNMPVFSLLYATNSSERETVEEKPANEKISPTHFQCRVNTNIPGCRLFWKSSSQMQDTYLEQPVIYLNSSLNKVKTKKLECFADCSVSGKHCIIEGMKIDYIPADDDAADTVTPVNASNQGILLIPIMTVLGLLVLLILILLVVFRKKIPSHKFRCWELDHKYRKLKENLPLKRTSIDGGKTSKTITANRMSILSEVMDAENGLIELLFLKDLLTSNDMNKLSSATYLKNHQRLAFDVLHILGSRLKNSSNSTKFLEALDESEQTHVKLFVTTGELDENCSCRPLKKDELKDFDKKFPSLIKYLDSSEMFLKKLMEKNCITKMHSIKLQKCTSEQEKNTELLQIMKRRSYKSFVEFQSCLKETNQHVVMKLLVENHVSTAVVDKPATDVTGSCVIEVQVEPSSRDSGFESVSLSRQHSSSESSEKQHDSKC